MATKIEEFLKAKKIDPRRILAASNKLERLQPEDRAMRLTKRTARKGEDADAKKKAAELKPRTGRPVTQRSIDAVLAGKEVSGPIKTRILRAVNHLLEQKKQDKIELAALFDPTPRKAKAEEKSE
ncbi:MAG TPA: hypothetical protein VHB21_20315 [Minicystis sp.]|nr:hypothetical protein [Minicystis sp.]